MLRQTAFVLTDYTNFNEFMEPQTPEEPLKTQLKETKFNAKIKLLKTRSLSIARENPWLYALFGVSMIAAVLYLAYRLVKESRLHATVTTHQVSPQKGLDTKAV